MSRRLKRPPKLEGGGSSSKRLQDTLLTDAFIEQHTCTQDCPCAFQEAIDKCAAVSRIFKEKVKAYLEEPRPKPSQASRKSESIEMKDERDMSEHRTAFDLVDLVAEYELYSKRDKDSRLSLKHCIGWLRKMDTEAKDLSAKDPSFQLEKHLDSVIDRLHFREYSLNVMLGRVQSFNVEKIHQPPDMENSDIYSQRNERLNPGQARLTLRSAFNDPMILIREASERRNLQQKSKKFDLNESLARMNRNLSALVDKAQKINKSLSCDDPVLSPRDLSFYKSIPVPDSFPHKIKENLSDIEFLQSECTKTRDALKGLHSHVLMALGVWVGHGKVSWDWGTSHIHDLPHFRRYEYHRNDLRSMMITLRLAEEKVINYLTGWLLNKLDGPPMPLKLSSEASRSAAVEGQDASPALALDSGTASQSRFAGDIETLDGQKRKDNEEAVEISFGSGGAQSLTAPMGNLQLQDEKEPLSRKLSDMTDATAPVQQPTSLTSSLESSGPRQSPTSATTLSSSTRLPVYEANMPVPMQLFIPQQRNSAVAPPKWLKELVKTLEFIKTHYPNAEPQTQQAFALCAEYKVVSVSKETREREWDKQLGSLHEEFPALACLTEQMEGQFKKLDGWDCKGGNSTEEDVGEKEAKSVDEEQGPSKKKRNNKNKNKNRKIKRQEEKKAAKEAHSRLEVAES